MKLVWLIFLSGILPAQAEFLQMDLTIFGMD
jgi:hypothetical protein